MIVVPHLSEAARAKLFAQMEDHAGGFPGVTNGLVLGKQSMRQKYPLTFALLEAWSSV